jgi:hypothetical protein
MWSEIRQIPQGTACLVSIDSRIAAFDTPAEWLQLTLHERPCWMSDWVIVVAHSGAPKSASSANTSTGVLDPVVVEILDSYAIIDILVSDASVGGLSVDMVIVPFTGTTIQLQSLDDAAIVIPASPGGSTTVHSRRKDRKNSTQIGRKILSKTSWTDIIWAFIIAAFGGLLVNISLRDIGKRISYSAITG